MTIIIIIIILVTKYCDLIGHTDVVVFHREPCKSLRNHLFLPIVVSVAKQQFVCSTPRRTSFSVGCWGIVAVI